MDVVRSRVASRSVPVWCSDPPVRIVPMSVEDIAVLATSIHRLSVMNAWRRQRARARSRAWIHHAEFSFDQDPPLALERENTLLVARGSHESL